MRTETAAWLPHQKTAFAVAGGTVRIVIQVVITNEKNS